MYMSGLFSVLFIQKLSAGKKFKLVKCGFGKKNKEQAKKLNASNLKTETIL